MESSDFGLIAGALLESRPVIRNHTRDEFISSSTEWRQWRLTCEAVADALANADLHFDRYRFLNACGVETIATQGHAIRKEGGIRETLLRNIE